MKYCEVTISLTGNVGKSRRRIGPNALAGSVRIKDGLSTENGFKGLDDRDPTGETDRQSEGENPEPVVAGVFGDLESIRIAKSAHALEYRRQKRND